MKPHAWLAALFRRLLAAHRFYQAQHQHRMNEMYLVGVRRELAGLEKIRKELLTEQIEALIDLDASAARVRRLGHVHQDAQCVQ